MSRVRSALRASPAMKPLEYFETISSCCSSASIVPSLVAKVSGNFILNFLSKRLLDSINLSACSSTFNCPRPSILIPVLTPTPIPRSIKVVFPPSVSAFPIFWLRSFSSASGFPISVSIARLESTVPSPVLSADKVIEAFPGPIKVDPTSAVETIASLDMSSTSLRLGPYSSASTY